MQVIATALLLIAASMAPMALAQAPADALKQIIAEGSDAYLDWPVALAERERAENLYQDNGYRLLWSAGERARHQPAAAAARAIAAAVAPHRSSRAAALRAAGQDAVNGVGDDAVPPVAARESPHLRWQLDSNDLPKEVNRERPRCKMISLDPANGARDPNILRSLAKAHEANAPAQSQPSTRTSRTALRLPGSGVKYWLRTRREQRLN